MGLKLPWRVRHLNFNLFLDGTYYLTTAQGYVEMAKECLESIDKPYTKDKFDCDDFSATLYAYARYKYGINGVARVIDFLAHHSYNIVYTSDNKTYILEPQTAELIEIKKRDKRFYKLIGCLIIW